MKFMTLIHSCTLHSWLLHMEHLTINTVPNRSTKVKCRHASGYFNTASSMAPTLIEFRDSYR